MEPVQPLGDPQHLLAAVERLAREHGQRLRHRLVRELLEAREPFYARAHATVDADTPPAEAVAAQIIELARQRAGW